MEEHLKYSVGIDMAKKTFKVAIGLIDSTQKVTIMASSTFNNSSRGFNQFVRWVSKHKKEDLKLVWIMEATGAYHEPLAWYLFQNGYRVSVLLPNKAKKYMQSLGIRSKTDSIDAKGLARMGAEQNLPAWDPMDKDIYVLRGLTRYLEQLQESRNVFCNQLEAATHGMHQVKEVVKGIKAMIRTLDNQIEKTKKQIAQTVIANKELNRKVQLMTSIKGIGLLTATIIIAETNAFALIANQRQLVSFCGYDVVENSSGNRVGKTKISKKGNAHVRRALHMPAFSVINHGSSIFKNLYNRVFDRTNIKMKAYVAVQRKLLVMLYILWKKDQYFNPEYGISGNEEPKTLFSVGSSEPQNKVANPIELATLDELP